MIHNKKVAIKNKICPILSSDELLEFGKTNKYPNQIPKIIHYVYKTTYIPSQYVEHVYNCTQINENVKFVFWSDFTAYRFIINNFPDRLNIYESYFNKTSHSLKVSDVIRYFIIYKFGGVYMDLDTSCLKPFESVFINESCVLSQEIQEQSRILHNYKFSAMNSLMACIPYHRFFKHLISQINKSDDTFILKQTGPLFLTDQFNNYINLFNKYSFADPTMAVTVADPYLYSPVSNIYLEIICKQKLLGYWRHRGCEDLSKQRKIEKKRMKDAVAIHLFLHLGYSEYKTKINKTNNICFIFEYFTVIW